MSKKLEVVTITASKILAHVAKTRTLYRVPSGKDYEVEWDLGDDSELPLDAEEFLALTKEGFAREWGVDQRQIRRWIDAGMPVTDDDRIPRSNANNWIDTERAEWKETHIQRDMERYRRRLAAEEAAGEDREPVLTPEQTDAIVAYTDKLPAPKAEDLSDHDPE